jgi:hypothetical protein
MPPGTFNVFVHKHGDPLPTGSALALDDTYVRARQLLGERFSDSELLGFATALRSAIASGATPKIAAGSLRRRSHGADDLKVSSIEAYAVLSLVLVEDAVRLVLAPPPPPSWFKSPYAEPYRREEQERRLHRAADCARAARDAVHRAEDSVGRASAASRVASNEKRKRVSASKQANRFRHQTARTQKQRIQAEFLRAAHRFKTYREAAGYYFLRQPETRYGMDTLYRWVREAAKRNRVSCRRLRAKK